MAHTDRIDELETRVISLESRLLEIENETGSDTESRRLAQEQEAQELYTAIRAAMDVGKLEEARSMLERLNSEFTGSSAWRSGQRISVELTVPGKIILEDANSHIEFWFNEGTLDLESGTTLIVFFEQWCPHCRREVPKLQSIADSLGAEGLKVVSLTRLTKSSTEESVRALLEEHEVSYPVAKEDGQLAEWAEVSGIPAAIVVRDGIALWRGHPASLTESQLRKWLAED
jgi:thiol-disulfide isomerase/thioredoxin